MSAKKRISLRLLFGEQLLLGKVVLVPKDDRVEHNANFKFDLPVLVGLQAETMLTFLSGLLLSVLTLISFARLN